MSLNRRHLLTGTLAALAANQGSVAAAAPLPLAAKENPPGFPRKADFHIEEGHTYINAAYIHPVPKAALEAARIAGEKRGTTPPPEPSASGGTANAKELFSDLIGAKPTEIAYVPSTSFGENLVVQALGLHNRFDGNVVSDGLHYEGALMHLLELKKKGLDVRIVPPTNDFRIDMRDLERVVDRKTRLIEVSSVAMYNGFQHDLKAVSDLAHAHGAYVYADIIHSAGAGPFDIKASGVDFAACSSFKWLMGDFGIGFLYARSEVLDRIERPVLGYMENSDLEAFYPPYLPAGDYRPVDYRFSPGAAGMFEPGTFGGKAVNAALVAASLTYLRSLGLANIEAHRQPLLRRLQQEVPRLGLIPVTPPQTTAGTVTFAKKDIHLSEIPKKLQAARVNVRISRNWLRLSPSVYNDMNDVERFLEALS